MSRGRGIAARQARLDSGLGICVAGVSYGRVGLDAMIFWIGYCVLDSLFSYPERHFLSTTMFPIQNLAWLAS